MSPSSFPRISFGMIVLNGEPFIRYNLRALYPFAHEIIVVEGACPSAESFATRDGHSQDGTLETLRQFQVESDPQRKLIVVTAEDEGHPNGFWSEKDEMSQAYARRASGNYLWQVDVDEFYRSQDMQTVIEILRQDPSMKAVTFRVRTFWGGLGYRPDSIALRRGAQDFHRLFAWAPGYRYTTHRPPTVIDEQGRDLRTIKALTAADLVRRWGIYLYHYTFLFPFQVRFKLAYYGPLGPSCYLPKREAWMKNYFELKHPFLIDDTSVLGEPSWLLRYDGKHPEVILQLWQDIEQGKIKEERRATDDIERLVRNPLYKLAIYSILIVWKPIEWAWNGARAVRRIIRAIQLPRAGKLLR